MFRRRAQFFNVILILINIKRRVTMNRNPLNKVSLDTDNLVTRRIFAFDSNNQPLCNNYILAVCNSEARWVDTLRNIETYPGVGYLPITLSDISNEIRAVSNYFASNLSNSAEQLGCLQITSFQALVIQFVMIYLD